MLKSMVGVIHWKIRPVRLWHDVREVTDEINEAGRKHNLMSLMNYCKLKKKKVLENFFKNYF